VRDLPCRTQEMTAWPRERGSVTAGAPQSSHVTSGPAQETGFVAAGE
jgi:hypothetical protein